MNYRGLQYGSRSDFEIELLQVRSNNLPEACERLRILDGAAQGVQHAPAHLVGGNDLRNQLHLSRQSAREFDPHGAAQKWQAIRQTSEENPESMIEVPFFFRLLLDYIFAVVPQHSGFQRNRRADGGNEGHSLDMVDSIIQPAKCEGMTAIGDDELIDLTEIRGHFVGLNQLRKELWIACAPAFRLAVSPEVIARRRDVSSLNGDANISVVLQVPLFVEVFHRRLLYPSCRREHKMPAERSAERASPVSPFAAGWARLRLMALQSELRHHSPAA